MKHSSKRPPGRPQRSEATKLKDTVIAKSVYRLLEAGWSGKTQPRKQPGAFEIVGIEAERILGRTDADRGELGPDRVGQIYKAWRAAEQQRRIVARQWPLTQVSKWSVESLRERAPFNVGTSLREQAQALLNNGGEWPPEAKYRGHLGDRVATPKHAEWIERTMPRFAAPTPPSADEEMDFVGYLIAGLLANKNGVEK